MTGQIKPEEVVQLQVDAYNRLDADSFAESYSDSIEIYEFPDQLIISGKASLLTKYRALFASTPNLKVEVEARHVSKEFVVDIENVSGLSDGLRRAAAIYEVRSGLIQRAWFVRDLGNKTSIIS